MYKDNGISICSSRARWWDSPSYFPFLAVPGQSLVVGVAGVLLHLLTGHYLVITSPLSSGTLASQWKLSIGWVLTMKLRRKVPRTLTEPGTFSPPSLYDTYLIHHPEIHIFRDTMQRSSPIVKKNLDLRFLQIFYNLLNPYFNSSQQRKIRDSQHLNGRQNWTLNSLVS